METDVCHISLVSLSPRGLPMIEQDHLHLIVVPVVDHRRQQTRRPQDELLSVMIPVASISNNDLADLNINMAHHKQHVIPLGCGLPSIMTRLTFMRLHQLQPLTEGCVDVTKLSRSASQVTRLSKFRPHIACDCGVCDGHCESVVSSATDLLLCHSMTVWRLIRPLHSVDPQLGDTVPAVGLTAIDCLRGRSPVGSRENEEQLPGVELRLSWIMRPVPFPDQAAWRTRYRLPIVINYS